MGKTIFQEGESNVLSDPKGEPKEIHPKYFTYIARCSDKTLYIGITDNIIEREKCHNGGKGSAYTRVRIPIEIIYKEEYSTRSEAAKRERQLKGWIRIKKERLVMGKHPNLKNDV